MSVANQYEVQMLALINAERAKVGLQPLKLNAKLNSSAETHSNWMLNVDVFSHTGANGSSATDRMKAAGYVFSGSWSSGENIAWQSERGAAGISDDVINLHQSLMNSPGHRANILNPNFTEIGIGIVEGGFLTGGTNWPAVMVTQNFARSSADNGGSGGVVTPPPPPPPSPFPITEGADVINGSALADVIDARGGNDRVLGNDGHDILRGGFGNDSLYGGDGNDGLDGRDGDDLLDGATGDDNMFGGNGNDTQTGGLGNDTMRGEAGDDRLIGDQGSDSMSGGDGKDWVDGGADADIVGGGNGNDLVFGNSGDDQVYGGAGYDWLEGGSGSDRLYGGADADQFAFRPGFAVDRVMDFADNVDTLSFTRSLMGQTTTVQQFVATYAHVSGNSVVFDFGGGNVLTVDGVNSLAKLHDDISFFG